MVTTLPATTQDTGLCGQASTLKRVLDAGLFAVAAEVSPPVGPVPEMIQRQAEILRGYADAYNCTDNQAAAVHVSSMATAIMLKNAGLEPVAQFTTRDRNRLALQGDLLGAACFGITNVLALSGDHPIWGDHPQTKPVYDVDSISLIRMIHAMRSKQVFENGKAIPKRAPDFFIGAVANPFAPPFDYRPYRLAKKVEAGAQFIQTQTIYNVSRFREFMARVVDLGLHEKTYILAGIGPVRTLKMAEYMSAKVAGMDVPDEVVARFRGLTTKEDQQKMGLELALETSEAVKAMPGVAGLHIMAVYWPEAVPQLVHNLGLHPRPVPPLV